MKHFGIAGEQESIAQMTSKAILSYLYYTPHAPEASVSFVTTVKCPAADVNIFNLKIPAYVTKFTSVAAFPAFRSSVKL